MAHFAKLDENNVVETAITFSNEEVEANGGDLSVEAENFVAARHGGTWKQTSYNNNFRRRYAGQGFTYDPANDVFIPPQSFPSWTYNSTEFHYEPPVALPTKEQCDYNYNGEPYCYIPLWDEDTHQTWVAPHGDDNMYKWTGSAWEEITPTITREEFYV